MRWQVAGNEHVEFHVVEGGAPLPPELDWTVVFAREVNAKSFEAFVDCVYYRGPLVGLPLGLLAVARIRLLGRKIMRDEKKRKATK